MNSLRSWLSSFGETAFRQFTFLFGAAWFSLWWIPESVLEGFGQALRVNLPYLMLAFVWGMIVSRLWAWMRGRGWVE